jgi:TonB family protein
MLALIGATDVSAQRPIPEATKPCSPEVAKWWQDIRAALMDVVEYRRSHPTRRGSEIKEFDKRVKAARAKLLALVKEGQEKSYGPPIEDSANPIILYAGRPDYTERARENNTMGKIDLHIEYRADGTVGEVKVIEEGLKDGLNEKAIEAMRGTLFLPAVQNGVFTTVWKRAYVEFNLR